MSMRIIQLNLIVLQYLVHLKNWSIPMMHIDDLVKAEKEHGTSAPLTSTSLGHAGQLVQTGQRAQTSQLVLPDNPSKETTGLYKQLVLLQSGKSHTETSDLHKIYANLSFAAAAIGLSSNAAWWKIEDVKSLKTEMAKYVVLPHCFRPLA